MVANGWAVAFRRFSLDYAADEERARSTKKGLWEGSFEMPWDWRAQRRAK
jgi:endonuclease YncB( thermonuclease family)